MSRERDYSGLIVLAILAGAVWLAWQSAGAHVEHEARAQVANCPPPAQDESLLITVAWRDEKLTATCLYVGSRGSVSRKPVRQIKQAAAQ